MPNQQAFLTHYAKEIGIVVRPHLAAAPVSNVTAPEALYQADLSQLRIQALECDACRLCEERTQVVFGKGNPKADLMIIGEAPSQEEDRLAEPFVDHAGQLFNQMLQAIQYPRDQIYISNIVLCRPPQDRNPHQDEADACRYWLEAQWQAVQPKVVCLLGKVAMQYILGKTSNLATVRGQWFEHLNSKVMVSYHPAHLLRAPSHKALAWQDMQMLMREVNTI